MTRKGKFVVNKVELQRQCTVDIHATPSCSVSTINMNANMKAALSENKTPVVGRKPPKMTNLMKFEYILLLVNRLLIGFVSIYLCWMCLRLDRADIPWHAILSTLGFLCLMSEGLLAHYRANSLTQLCKRPEKTHTHWVLQLTGSIIGIAGVMVKIDLEDVHFHTLHGQLGLAALVVLGFSLCSGLSALYSNELRGCVQPLINKACHNVLGLVTYLLAMLSMYTSFDTDVFLEHSLDGVLYMDFRILLRVSIALILLLTSYGPCWCLIYSKLWKCC